MIAIISLRRRVVAARPIADRLIKISAFFELDFRFRFCSSTAIGRHVTARNNRETLECERRLEVYANVDAIRK